MTTAEVPFDFDSVAFVTSDHHFGHARIIELAGRPFASVEGMDEEMIARWNAVVAPGDVVLHLGDLALGPIADSVARTADLHGRRFLVPGNHDRVSPATQTVRGIERFRPMYEDAGWSVLPEILVGTRRGRSLLASHYPYAGDSTGVERHSTHRPDDTGIPLIHGHTHDRTFGPHASHEFHVGVDATEFAPLPFSVIDAWLAGLPTSEQSDIGSGE
ncbi:metallophosphoesterase [Microbacterium gorillae]|uniref:metallophosphoesterase n=1 Tax=Microbacterium gorillae TaxID=1231063 RepID=UPI0006942B08|nr:metallophosphoesterase [Microbacterium gorillae]